MIACGLQICCLHSEGTGQLCPRDIGLFVIVSLFVPPVGSFGKLAISHICRWGCARTVSYAMPSFPPLNIHMYICWIAVGPLPTQLHLLRHRLIGSATGADQDCELSDVAEPRRVRSFDGACYMEPLGSPLRLQLFNECQHACTLARVDPHAQVAAPP